MQSSDTVIGMRHGLPQYKRHGALGSIGCADGIEEIVAVGHHSGRPEVTSDMIRRNTNVARARERLNTRGTAHRSRTQALIKQSWD